MVVDVVVIVVVVALFLLCVRSFFKGGDACSDCAMGADCSMRGEGDCMVAKTMIDDAERAVADSEATKQ